MPTPMPTLAPVDRPPEFEADCASVAAPVGVEELKADPVGLVGLGEVGAEGLEVDVTAAVGLTVTILSIAVSVLWNMTTMPFAKACDAAEYEPIRIARQLFRVPSLGTSLRWGHLTGAHWADFERAEIVVSGDDVFQNLTLLYC